MSVHRLPNVLMLFALLLASSTLDAQLDPRLQAGRTDFLNLYQQSTTLKPKPEIVTIFDFSGSMNALMYHPLYNNTFINDNDTTRTISFSLNNNTNVPSAQFNTAISGLSLTFVDLIKPNGSAVTKDDAEACQGLKNFDGGVIVAAATKGLYSASGTANKDVRHWVMAASHVRFKSGDRTIDIPLPWKIMDFNSTGNPLSSKVIKDEQKKATTDKDGKPQTVTYGSGQSMEFDLNYRIGTTGMLTTSALSNINYHITYIKWLFTGKYQNTNANNPNYTTDARLVNKYIAFDAAATNSAYLAAGQTSAEWGQGFRGQQYNSTMRDKKIIVPRYNGDGTYRDTIEDYAYKYATPAFSRAQANKVAAISTWVAHQADVYWAFRFLDPGTNEANSGNATAFNNNSKVGLATADPLKTKLNGNDSGWTVLNNKPSEGINSASGNSVKGMQRIAAAFTSGNTPLTYAMARTLAQYNDTNSVFNDIVGEDVSQCSNSFLILFTDGVDNNGSSSGVLSAATPYISNAGSGLNATFSAVQGNREIIKNPTRINRALAPSGNSPDYNTNTVYWNLFTYAAMGAHLADSSFGSRGTDYLEALDPGPKGSAVKSGRPADFLPFAVGGRNGIKYANGHRVTTMTVGVSLGGKYTDTSSPKRSLFLGAVMGDPDTTSGRLGSFRNFLPPTFKSDGTVDQYNDWLEDPSKPEAYPAVGKRAEGAVYFFDAQDPDALAAALETAFQAAISLGTNNATSSPNLPMIGASLGGQVYMGSFYTPDGGGVTWTGDLCMFGTREEGGSVKMINKHGNVATTLDAVNAVWSATAALKEKRWDQRTLYTRLPGASDSAPLKKFTDQGSDYDNSTTGLKNYIATNQLAAVRFAMGADTLKGPFDANGRPTANRITIMGDIIDSAPAAIEYAWNSVKEKLGAHPRLSAVGGDRFRLILVGTNQGWMHAFGEVTKTIKITDSNGVQREMVTGDAEELWAFMPTDFLKELDYITHPGNIHRFMVDGAPAIYHLDIPSQTGGIGNGIADPGERVVVMFGLGKGGRSYYALNIEDPFGPKMQWSLVPDEAASFPSSRIEPNCNASVDSVRDVLGRWGFSSATPAFGRVVYSGSTKQLKDAVFLGGGFSVDEVDEKFPDKSGKPTPLGRSVMALDTYSGNVLAVEDLAASFGQSVGPVGAGLIPFEFIVNSGAAQRAYFLDYKGGLWAWGANDVINDSKSLYDNFREDTSEIKKWGIRKVYQDSGAAKGNRYTTQPAPFRVGNFPGNPRSGHARPAAVAIAMVSGDRNNPLDYEYTAATVPDNHRLTVVFDRQDSEAWKTAAGMANGVITDGALADFSANIALSNPSGDPCGDPLFRLVTPGCSSYYLAPALGDPKFGYFINFPSKKAYSIGSPPRNGWFVPKGINPPTVVSGSLFYTIFKPAAADPCTGGLGTSESWVIADVLNPLKDDRRYSDDDGVLMYSHMIGEWGGVASDYIQVGTRGVIQGGTPVGGELLEIKTTRTDPSQGYPKVRVWRVVRQ